MPFGDIDALHKALVRRDVAAFIVEPIQGKGVYEAPPEYWHEAQALCRKYKTLLVMDEVQTGLGRTGKFFCHEHWDLRPDIITISKALSGGYVPVGAMLTTERVWTSVFSSLEKAMKHSTTFGRNQLAMVAGPRDAGRVRRREHRRARRQDRRGVPASRSPRSSSATRCFTRYAARA